jgi:DNA-binding LacI/PurR family transcriptional regulator
MPPTIADVAQRAGVGVGTVSRVLNDSPRVSDATRARVLAVIEEMDYRPSFLARALSKGTAGVLAALVQRMTTPSALQRLRGILDEASAAGFDVILHNVNDVGDYRNQIRDLLRPDRCAGGLLVSLKPDVEDIAMLTANPVPVVLIDGKIPGVSGLHIDDELGGRMATEHLISLGHCRIAFIGDWEDPIGFHPSGKRLAGYRSAMADAGLAVPGHYVKSGLHERAVTLQHIDELLDLDQPPTAVVASADSHAMIAAEGARAHGFSVPDDLSVVGFDDLDIAQHLDLSTIRQPLYESGAQGTRMLLDIMEGVLSAPQQVEMPLELVARGSTAAPRYS